MQRKRLLKTCVVIKHYIILTINRYRSRQVLKFGIGFIILKIIIKRSTAGRCDASKGPNITVIDDGRLKEVRIVTVYYLDKL